MLRGKTVQHLRQPHFTLIFGFKTDLGDPRVRDSLIWHEYLLLESALPASQGIMFSGAADQIAKIERKKADRSGLLANIFWS